MEPLARWLLTYLLHSTVLLGAAWLVRLALGERRLAVQEAVLRAALVGGFVTASLQIGLDVRPLGGALAVPAARPAPVLTPAPAPAVWRGRPVVESSLPPWASAAATAVLPRWRTGLEAAWAALAFFALARLLVAAFRLRRMLRGRRRLRPGEIAPGALLAADALGLRRPVLSEARHLSVPLATGVLRPEVCLPSRALDGLGADEQVALCAHELAHLARRDPAWVLLARLVEALAPVQPLNAWARRRLSDLAECLSDDLAVSASARPLGLARSLVDVASWTLGERPFLPVAASGALSARSRLGHRVERLMDRTRAVERPHRILLPAAALVVLATALVTPVVSGSAAPPDPPAPQVLPEAKAAAASKAAAVSKADAEDQLNALSRRIEERAQLQEADRKALEAKIEALTSRIPAEAEMQALSREIGEASRAFAEAVAADLQAGTAGVAHKSERTAEAARRMAEAEAKIHAATRDIRLPADEIRALAEQARAVAERARPTAEEMNEIRRLTAESVRKQVEETRDAVRIAMEALRQAREAVRQTGKDVQD